MYAEARQAYESATKTTLSSRELEASALFRAARRLEAARENWDSDAGRTELKEALSHNLRLWTFFQAELSRPDHELPAELRIDLLRLSAFIDRRTFELMARPDPDKVQALIDIDRHIASGLAEVVR